MLAPPATFLPTPITAPIRARPCSGECGRGFKDALWTRDSRAVLERCLPRARAGDGGARHRHDGDSLFYLTGRQVLVLYVIERLAGARPRRPLCRGGWRAWRPATSCARWMESLQPAVSAACRRRAAALRGAVQTAHRLSARPLSSSRSPRSRGQYARTATTVRLRSRPDSWRWPTSKRRLKEVAPPAVALQVEEPQHHIAGANGTANAKDSSLHRGGQPRDAGRYLIWSTCGQPNQQPCRTAVVRALVAVPAQTKADVLPRSAPRPTPRPALLGNSGPPRSSPSGGEPLHVCRRAAESERISPRALDSSRPRGSFIATAASAVKGSLDASRSTRPSPSTSAPTSSAAS